MKIPAALHAPLRRFLSPDLQKLARASSWTILASATTASLFLLEVMLLARYLPPELLGAYFLIISFPELVQLILDVRVRELMTRYVALFLARGEPGRTVAVIKLLWLADVTIALLALIVMVGLSRPAAVALFGRPDYAPLMMVYSLGLFFDSLDSASGALLRVLDRFDLAFWGGLASSLGRLGLIVGVVVARGPLGWLIAARAAALVLDTLLLGALSLREGWKLLGPHYRAPLRDLAEFRGEIFRFAFHINISSTARALATKLDVVVVGLLLTPAAVAVYKLATQFAKTPTVFTDALSTALYPQFARLAGQRDPARIGALVRRLTVLMAALIVPAGLALVWLREPLVRAFAGAGYSGYATLFVLAAGSTLLAAVGLWVRPYLLSSGLGRVLTLSHVGSLGVGMLVLVALTRPYGVVGAVIGYAVMSGLIVPLGLLQLARRPRPAAGAPLPVPLSEEAA
ncbi:MAG: oligosaccharide flippase family protein [Anaerolineales bacterium]